MAEATQVGSLRYDLDIPTDKLDASLDAADKKVKVFADEAGAKFSIMGDKVQAGFRTAAKGLAVIGVGLSAFAASATSYTVDLVKSSKALGRQIGVSTEEASRLTAAFTKMGIESESAQQMFGIFSKQIVASTTNTTANRLATEKLRVQIDKTKQSISETKAEITKSGDKTGELSLKLRELNNNLEIQENDLKQSSDAFARLGVKTTDAEGKQKDFNTILFEVADKFKALPDGVDKTALSMELFGRSGKDMIKVLNLGSDGIKDLEKEADRLGLTLNAQTIAGVNGLVQSQKKLKQQTDALKVAVGTATAPVLTAFNTKLNEMVAALIQSDGPLRTLTVNTLAFGGPIASGAAGIAGFLGNLGSALPIIQKFGAAIKGIALFFMGPWGIAILAVIAGLSYLISQFINTKSASEKLRSAQDALKTSTDTLKGAQDNLANASLNLEGAQLNLERAQRSYNEAVQQFGPGSLEAREALHNLEVAQQGVKDAQDRTKQSQQELQDAQSKVAKDKELVLHLKETKAGLDDANSSALKLSDAFKLLNVGGMPKGATAAAIAVAGQSARTQKRAGGGPVQAGMGYTVGEAGREVIFPDTNGWVMNASNTRSLMDSLRSIASHGVSSGGGGDLTVNIGTVEDRQDAQYIIDEINRNYARVNMGISPA